MNKFFFIAFLLISSVTIAQKSKKGESDKVVPVSYTVAQKDSMIQRVYNRIFMAKGDKGEQPEIRLVYSKSQAASYTPSVKNPYISIENDALEVCLSYGERRDDAIAFLISHEIGHHFTYKFWEGNYSDFSLKIKDSLILKYGIDTLATQKDAIKAIREIKADEMGGILRYMAGYSSKGISETFWTTLYKSYSHFRDTMTCYPPLQDRMQIASMADKRAQLFMNIFEMATYAVLQKEYDFAMDQYKALINEFDFKSREIFNNMGVIRYWQAMALAGENEIRFIYPIEIDLESRITSVSARGLDAAAIAKFREARDYFENAISHDNEYWTAYINQACIYSILKDDLYMARSRCKAVIENAENKVDVQNAKLILALIEMQDEEGDKDKASRTISELSEGGNEYAVLNQSILNGSSWSEIVFTGPLNPTEAEDENDGVTNKRTIESISGLKGMREHMKLQGSVPSDTVIYGNPRQELITFYYDQAKVLQNEYKLFITTNPGYTDTTSLGIKVGSTDKELKEKYGLPIVILSAAGGWVYNYPKSKMMVVLDQDKRVRKWIIYPEL